jgi:hypothetical protein
MDFVERWLGFSPDGGNGTFEMLLVVAVAAIPLTMVAVFRQVSAKKRSCAN